MKMFDFTGRKASSSALEKKSVSFEVEFLANPTVLSFYDKPLDIRLRELLRDDSVPSVENSDLRILRFPPRVSVDQDTDEEVFVSSLELVKANNGFDFPVGFKTNCFKLDANVSKVVGETAYNALVPPNSFGVAGVSLITEEFIYHSPRYISFAWCLGESKRDLLRGLRFEKWRSEFLKDKEIRTVEIVLLMKKDVPADHILLPTFEYQANGEAYAQGMISLAKSLSGKKDIANATDARAEVAKIVFPKRVETFSSEDTYMFASEHFDDMVDGTFSFVTHANNHKPTRLSNIYVRVENPLSDNNSSWMTSSDNDKNEAISKLLSSGSDDERLSQKKNLYAKFVMTYYALKKGTGQDKQGYYPCSKATITTDQ